MLLYETRPKDNGDYEVWRRIPGSKAPVERGDMFHNFIRDIESSVNIAEINAEQFVKEQNERERLLGEGLRILHSLM